MTQFAAQYLDVDSSLEKDVRLVKALLDLIAQDSSIGNDARFYCVPDGTPVTKHDLTEMSDFCLPAFLLGIWRYAVLHWSENYGRQVHMRHMVSAQMRRSSHLCEEYGRGYHAQHNRMDAGGCGSGFPGATKKARCGRIRERAGDAEDSPPETEATEKEKAAVDADPKRITVINNGTVENQKFVSIEIMNGDLHL
jgi:hypothetical protein